MTDNKKYTGLTIKYEAALLEFQASCLEGLSGKIIEDSRMKIHDLLDEMLDMHQRILSTK